MGLRIDQTRELLALYLEGKSIKEIADKLITDEENVKSFIPKGELNIAYQTVITAHQKMVDAKSDSASAVDNLEMLETQDRNCGVSASHLDTVVALTASELKRLKATLKQVRSEHTAVKDQLEPAAKTVSDSADAHTEAVTNHIKAEALLKACQNKMQLDRQREVDRKEQIKQAEKMAEAVIISAAIEGAKDMVARSVDARLDRERNE